MSLNRVCDIKGCKSLAKKVAVHLLSIKEEPTGHAYGSETVYEAMEKDLDLCDKHNKQYENSLQLTEKDKECSFRSKL